MALYITRAGQSYPITLSSRLLHTNSCCTHDRVTPDRHVAVQLFRMASTLGDLLIAQPPDSPALILPSAPSLSYGEFAAHVHALADSLALTRTQHVAIALPNGVEFVLAFFATTSLGAVACPFNPGYTQAEFEFYLNDTKPDILLVPRGFLTSIPAPPCIGAACKLSVPVKEVVFDHAAVATPLRPCTRPKVQSDDVALILHTSGTTGRPKAVPLTHANLLATARNIVQTYALSPADNTYLVQVLFHIHGIVAALLAPLLSGGRITLPARFDPSRAWSEFAACGCTWLTAVPSILQILLHAPAPAGLHMRFLRSCSSPLSPSTLEQLETRFGAPVLEAYAMTEAAHQMTSNPLPPAGAPRAMWARRPGSVGKAQGTEIAIYEGDKRVGPGVHGDVCVRAPSVTKGYIKNPKANAEAFISDGFFRTGDRGFLDQDGFLTLVGRNSEIINRGGEKISPIEVDAALLGCSTAIREAVCFAVPDELMGQEVEAAVVLAEGQTLDEAGLQALVGRVLADFKVPKRVHFVQGAIPKGPTGKIQRKNLTATFARKSVVAKAMKPTEVEGMLKALLGELLYLDPSAITDGRTLFELGADSIVFIRLVSALRASGLHVSMRELFQNPSIGALVALLKPKATEEADPAPFELFGAAGARAQADIARQLGLRVEDVEDAYPLIRGQAIMYRAAQRAPNTATWIVGDIVVLKESVDVERWMRAWEKVFAHEACLRGTLVGRVEGQDAAYPEEVNTAYLSPQARGPHWVKLHGDSKAGAYAAVQVYAAGLRHAIGKPAVHFVLAAYPGGNFFALLYDHMFLEAGSRELVQTAASTVYLRPETTLQNYGCGSWARYVRHAMRLEADVAFWEKEFAPSARLPAFHTARRIGAEADMGVKLKKRHVVLELPLGQMSQALGVSVPLLAESAFCLAVSLYWSQIGGRTEPAYYAKTISRRYEGVKDMFDIRGLPFQMNTALVSVATAHHSIWAFVNAFMDKVRAVEDREQSVEHAETRTAIAWYWRVQRPVPDWDQLVRLIDSVWRPVSPTELVMRRVAPTKMMVYQLQDVWFADEFKRRGCGMELLDIAVKTLEFYAQGELETKTYGDLQEAVFGAARNMDMQARL